MRNLKKMAALGAAAVMALSMNVSAFASVAGNATASYSDGKVILNSLADIDADHQWTVVVIKEADQNENLTADKLFYINQGTSGDAFWTDGMGTKTELEAGNYIVRIGGETIATADKLIEIPLKVTSGETPSFVWGDVDGIEGVSANDASTVLKHVALITELTGNNLLAADVDGIEGVSANDATTILKKVALLIDKFPVEK